MDRAALIARALASVAEKKRGFIAVEDALDVLEALEQAGFVIAPRAEIYELRAFRDRINAAVEFAPAPYGHSEERIVADLQDGMSLRQCAAKHGTTFGVVRGIKRKISAAGSE